MIGSYKYDNTILTYKALLNQMNLNENTKNHLDYDFKINYYLPEALQIQQNGFQKYSITGVEIKLERFIRKYIMNYYLPPACFVMASWVSLKSFYICVYRIGFMMRYTNVQY